MHCLTKYGNRYIYHVVEPSCFVLFFFLMISHPPLYHLVPDKRKAWWKSSPLLLPSVRMSLKPGFSSWAQWVLGSPASSVPFNRRSVGGSLTVLWWAAPPRAAPRRYNSSTKKVQGAHSSGVCSEFLCHVSYSPSRSTAWLKRSLMGFSCVMSWAWGTVRPLESTCMTSCLLLKATCRRVTG